LGGLAFYGTRQVAPAVNSSRQGITLDDDGNIVTGAVGVVPVKTPKPTPKPTKAPPRVVQHTEVVEAPAPAPQDPQVIYVDPGPGYTEPHDEGSSHTSNTTETESSGGTSGGCCSDGGGHDPSGHHP
jgi:hypothetical protein